jgi:hypothetical protein
MSPAAKILGAILAAVAVVIIWISWARSPAPSTSDAEEARATVLRREPTRGVSAAARLEEFAERRRARQERSGQGAEGEQQAKRRLGAASDQMRPKSQGAGQAPAAGGAADEETFESARYAALTDPDPNERIRALESLSLYEEEDGQSLPVLAQALNDPDTEVRLAALDEIAQLTETPPLDLIGPSLRDPDAEVRLSALRIIGDSEEEARIPLLRSALNDTDEDVRSEAEEYLDFEEDFEGENEKENQNEKH